MQNRILGLLIALLGWLGPVSLVLAQQWPQTLPANTVYGRLNVSPGPGQAIPISRLFNSLMFLQAGSGAVSRSAQDKMRESFSVRDFGAVGDGTTNDGVAIQAAITAAIAKGGGEVRIPASTGCYITTDHPLLVDLSGISTRYQGRIHIVGEGQSRSCIQNTTGAGIIFTGKSSNSEVDFLVKDLRLQGTVGAVQAGSIGLQVKFAAYVRVEGVAVEGFDLGFDGTDFEQSTFSHSLFSYNTGGMQFNAATTTTSPNSINFISTTVSHNTVYGVVAVTPNSFNWFGGSIQYNGTLTCGGTLANCWGMRLFDTGNGYGTVLLDGLIFEGNSGVADIQTTQINATQINMTLNNVAFARVANFYATNNLLIDGTQTNSNYKIINSNFCGFGAYSFNAGRPNITITNANAKVDIDGSSRFCSNLESPTTSTIFSGYAGQRTGRVGLSGATSGTLFLTAPAAAGSGVLTMPVATDTLVGKATTDTLTNKTYDTAGAGNSFSINGNAINAVTGTGNTAVLAVSPTIGGTALIANMAGGSAAGSTAIIASTTSGAPAADSVTVLASTITLRKIGSGGTSTVNVGVGGTTAGSLAIGGSSSGSTALQAAAAASGTLTLPAATDTLVGKATTDTLTNKTYDTAGTGNVFKINTAAVSGVANGVEISGGNLQLSAARRTLPTTQNFTSGSGTYTTPANALYIRVRAVGAGGGGAGGGTTPGSGGAGGNTTFSTLTAAGGSAAVGPNNGSGGACSGQTFGLGGGNGGGGGGTGTNGGIGGANMFGGAGQSGTPGAASQAGTANTGAGGGGGGSSSAGSSGAGGGAGAYCELQINSPGATFSYAVGAAGTAGTAGTGGNAGAAGGTGNITVLEFYN